MIRANFRVMPDPTRRLDYAGPVARPVSAAPPWLPWALFAFGCGSCLLNRLMVRIVGYAHDHGPFLNSFPVILFVAGAIATWRAGGSRTALLVLLNSGGAVASLVLAYLDLPKP